MTMKWKHGVYRAIRWAPLTKPGKFRLEREFMNWHWKRDMEVAKKTKNDEHIERGHVEWQYQDAELSEEEDEYFSNKLLKRARYLRVPTPARYEGSKLTSSYEESPLTYLVFLSLDGEKAVRAAIREEEEHRAKRQSKWVTFVTVLTGLAGAITGLVSAIDKFGK